MNWSDLRYEKSDMIFKPLADFLGVPEVWVLIGTLIILVAFIYIANKEKLI